MRVETFILVEWGKEHANDFFMLNKYYHIFESDKYNIYLQKYDIFLQKI